MIRNLFGTLFRRRIVRRTRRPSAVSQKHYQEHKEAARALVMEKLEHFNRHYGFSYNRVSIKNTRTKWGSCSSKKNLNFSYRIIFLPPHLQDYLVVHELCHLGEMNHGPAFWNLVEETIPDSRTLNGQIKRHAILDARNSPPLTPNY